jgi:DNA-binding transcriptional MerR regulator
MRPLMTDVEDRPLVSQDDERRGQKSADAYRTISEVADELKLPQHVLRFWESKFKQIMPMKRAGGRRFYRPQDIELIKRIHYLLYTQGYTIKGVQKLLAKDRQLAQSVPSLTETTASIDVSEVLQRAEQQAQQQQPANTQAASPAPKQPVHDEKRQAELMQLLKRLKELRSQLAV